MVGRLWETTESLAALDSVGRALRHMSDGFLAVDADWRVLYVNGLAERLLGPSRELVGRTLWDIPQVSAPGLESGCRQAVADRRPTGLDLRLPADGRWYHLRLIPVPDGLTVYLTDVTERRQLEEERLSAEHAAAERAARIGELTAALAEALTAEDVVAAAAERVLPLFGATGLIVQAREGGRVQPVGSVGYPRAFLDQLARGGIPAGSLSELALQDGIPRFIASLEEMEADYPGMSGLPSMSGKQAWAFLPLMVSGRAVGGCVVSFDRPRRLTGEERTLLVALSGLVAQALERARQYDAEHGRAQALQRGLLPRALPSLPAVAAAARYLPASEGTLGGDWYDVIPLSADRVALVIGDVMGHGLPEAATMGRLRTAVHTLAGLELPPDELFSHLNDLVSELGDDFYATCLYALYDPASGLCTFAGAGHPPPAVVHPDGTVHFPDVAANPPLGAATPPFETTELKLPEEASWCSTPTVSWNPPGATSTVASSSWPRHSPSASTARGNRDRPRSGEPHRVPSGQQPTATPKPGISTGSAIRLSRLSCPPRRRPTTMPLCSLPALTRSRPRTWPPGPCPRTPSRRAWPASMSGISCPHGSSTNSS